MEESTPNDTYMNAKTHYDNHLADFYAWMVGDFTSQKDKFKRLLYNFKIAPFSSKTAVDFGAGHGIQSIALYEKGYTVTAVDFNHQLLQLLSQQENGEHIRLLEEDLMYTTALENSSTELIVCCGDTIAHLDNKTAINNFIARCAIGLTKGGKLLLSFRDYSSPLSGTQRFIPVKSDDTRILTCFLEYEEEKVTVTDLLQEKEANGWTQKVSSYQKVRTSPQLVAKFFEQNALKLVQHSIHERMHYMVGEK